MYFSLGLPTVNEGFKGNKRKQFVTIGSKGLPIHRPNLRYIFTQQTVTTNRIRPENKPNLKPTCITPNV